MANREWVLIQTLVSKSYVCSYCGNPLASNKGYNGNYSNIPEHIYLCHHCGKPTYFDYAGKQTPNSTYGDNVNTIGAKEVELLYTEARNCISCNAFTASVLCSRKLLMNIAVSKGAPPEGSFLSYVEYLSNKGYVPPDGKEWVDHIRKKGNEATHEISIKIAEEAKDLIDFLEMLLKFIYEFPARVKAKK